MQQKFYICEHSWICPETKHGIPYTHPAPGGEPRANFTLCEGDEVRAVYAFCNQHNLWRN